MYKGRIEINKGTIWRYVSEGLKRDYMASYSELKEFDEFLRFKIEDFNLVLGGGNGELLSKEF